MAFPMDCLKILTLRFSIFAEWLQMIHLEFLSESESTDGAFPILSEIANEPLMFVG